MERRILVTSPVLLSLKRDVQIFINSLQPRSPLRFCFLARVPFFSLLASEDRALPSVCMFYIDCCQQDLAEMVKDRLVPFLSKNGNHCPERVCHCELRRKGPESLNIACGVAYFIYTQKHTNLFI